MERLNHLLRHARRQGDPADAQLGMPARIGHKLEKTVWAAIDHKKRRVVGKAVVIGASVGVGAATLGIGFVFLAGFGIAFLGRVVDRVVEYAEYGANKKLLAGAATIDRTTLRAMQENLAFNKPHLEGCLKECFGAFNALRQLRGNAAATPAQRQQALAGFLVAYARALHYWQRQEAFLLAAGRWTKSIETQVNRAHPEIIGQYIAPVLRNGFDWHAQHCSGTLMQPVCYGPADARPTGDAHPRKPRA